MSKGKGHIPVRTCLSCRARRPRGELIRLVQNAGGVVVRDMNQTREGRGAYVCGNESCLRSLGTGGRLARAFRTHVPLSIHPDGLGSAAPRDPLRLNGSKGRVC